MTVEEHLTIGYRRQIIDALKILHGYCVNRISCEQGEGGMCAYGDICTCVNNRLPDCWNLPDPEDIGFLKKEVTNDSN